MAASTADMAMGELVFQRANQTTERFPLAQEAISIGRGAAARIQVFDEYISRIHCELSLRESQVVLRDLNSHNGTFVNKQRIQETVLKTDDAIRLGMTDLAVALQDKPSSSGRDVDVILRVLKPPQPEPANTVRIELPSTPPPRA